MFPQLQTVVSRVLLRGVHLQDVILPLEAMVCFCGCCCYLSLSLSNFFSACYIIYIYDFLFWFIVCLGSRSQSTTSSGAIPKQRTSSSSINSSSGNIRRVPSTRNSSNRASLNINSRCVFLYPSYLSLRFKLSKPYLMLLCPYREISESGISTPSSGGQSPKSSKGQSPTSDQCLEKPSSPSTPTKPTWQCSVCTYDNSVTAVACDMCHSSRCLSSSTITTITSGSSSTFVGTVTSPAVVMPRDVMNLGSTLLSGTNTIVRHQSELMDDLRRIEEKEALDKWQHIVCYCTEVCFILRCVLMPLVLPKMH